MVVNDEALVRDAMDAIIKTPTPENVILFKKALPDVKYSESIKRCFGESEYIYVAHNGSFYAAIGARMTSLLDCTVWFAHTDGAKVNTRFLLRQGKLAFDWLTQQFAPLCVLGNSFIHREFVSACRLAERFGFSKVMQVGDIIVYKYMFGEY